MVHESHTPDRIRFGRFEAHLSARELRREGIKVKLQELPFHLLVALLERPGEVVTREELQTRLWPKGTHVDFEGGVGTALNKLRDALGDSAANASFIETIPRRGYRFIAAVERGVPGTESPPAVGIAPSVLPWRKYTVPIGIAAIAILAGVAFLGLRSLPQRLTNQDILVLADLTNLTGDPVFDGTLREALAFQLEQSPFLKVLDDEVMRQDLELMRRSPQERLTNELAHNICVREADKAILGGSIAGLGKSYIIELKATNCQSGETLARQQAEAADKEHVLGALAKAAEGMRARLGESLDSIQKLAPPELRVTTSSIEAFHAYTAGQVLFNQTRFVKAIPLLQRATDLDHNLAFAWAWLASATLNTGAGGNRARVQEYSDKAWALRDQVSEYERLWLTGARYQSAGQLDKAAETYELTTRVYPRDPIPFSQLALTHAKLGESEEALRNDLEALRLAPRRPIEAGQVMADYVRLDRFEKARAIARKHFAQGFDTPQVHRFLLAIAWIEDDQQVAASQIQWFTGKPEEHIALEDEAIHAWTRGELRRSRQLLERAADLARRRNLPDVAARLLAPNVDREALIGNCEPARDTGAASPVSLALCGAPAMVQRAEKRAEETSKQRPDDVLWNGAQLPLIRAAIDYSLGQNARAIEVLDSVKYERAYPVARYLRGLAFLYSKKGSLAANEFQNIVDHRGANWGPLAATSSGGSLYPLSWIGLARGATLAEDTTRARRAYEHFFAMWKDADPDVPVLNQALKEYAELKQ